MRLAAIHNLMPPFIHTIRFNHPPVDDVLFYPIIGIALAIVL